MTHDKWGIAHDPEEMLEELGSTTLTHRLWEYVSLCLRGVGANTSADLLRRHLAGELREEDLTAHREECVVQEGVRAGGGYSLGKRPVRMNLAAQRARASLAALNPTAWIAAEQVTAETRHQLQRDQCDWLRCLFLSPILPAFDPKWRTTSVVALAKQIDETVDFSILPVLADALEEAGCFDASILAHCRSTGTHVRGCWVVDAALGRK